MYGVPHGLGNAILLPTCSTSSGRAASPEQRLAELAVAIGAGAAAESKAVLARGSVERVRELNRAVGIPEKARGTKPGRRA